MKESTRLTSTETAAWLRERDDFLVLTHRRPDGDALGSAAALCSELRALGKRAYLLENPETTARYQGYVAAYLAPTDFQPMTILVTDTADAGILQVNAGSYADRVDLAIDHHASHRDYAAYVCLDSERAACGEVVYEVLRALSGTINAETATLLYVALTTDTGCFAYANVTANTFTVAGELIRAGANYRQVNKKLFRTKSRGRMALDGALLTGLQFYHNGQTAVSMVTLDLMDRMGVTEDDLDDIATIPNLAEGVLVGIVVKELPEGGCKISVRSSPGFDCNAICQQFGGGGHPMAAGCTVNMTPEAALEALVTAVGEAL